MNIEAIPPLVVWAFVAAVALLTPVLGYLSPFGRARRSIVQDLRADLDILGKKIDSLKAEIVILTIKVDECEAARSRLERENYRLYREIDGRTG